MKSRVFLLALFVLLTLQGAFVRTQQPTLPVGNQYVAGEVLISYEPWATTATKAGTRARLGASLKRALSLTPDGQLEVASLPPGLSVQAAINALQGSTGVQYAEPNWLYTHEAVPNDPAYTNGSLWGMEGDASVPANQFGSQAAEAWAANHLGDSNVYVAVIDEGIDYNHPDLAGNIWTNPFDPIDGIDNDGNGYIDDVHGWDFFSNNNSVFDGGPGSSVDSHGTHVSGTIGALGSNGVGVVGVNWDVTIISTKFLGPQGGSTAGAVAALNYITDMKTRHGLNIVATNNSWGGGGYSQALLDAITRAAKADILFIAAAGNSNSNNDTFPSYPSNYNTTQGTSTESAASYDSVIAVASITNTGAKSSFSSYGRTTVDFGAPGSGIVSTTPNNTYSSYSGTSMATPHVTGAAALYVSMQPVIPAAAAVRQALINSALATPTASLATNTVTGGRLNISYFLGGSTTPPPAAPTNLTANAASSSQINLSWTDQASDENGFQIERCQGATCTTFAPLASVGANVTTYQNIGLSGNTTYRYRVSAFNDGGNSSPSNIAAATTQPAPTVPAAPTNLSASVISGSQINLSWVDQASNETGFNIERCTGAGCTSFAPLVSVGPDVTTYQNTGLTAGTTYRYRVIAFNGVGNSTPSNVATGTTTGGGSTLPAAPTGLLATAGPAGSGQITLTWADNSGNETGFRIFRCGPAACGAITQIAETGANATTFVDTVPPGSGRYAYQVRAFNAAGMSNPSNGSSALAP